MQETRPANDALEQIGYPTFRRFQTLLRERTGIFLSPQKAPLLVSRLARRLRALACPDLEAYLQVLEHPRSGDSEFQEMVNRITTNKTAFFRERHHFDLLQTHVSNLLSEDPTRTLRIWSAGCSTGEEPYSVGALLCEQLRGHPAARAHVLATDIDTDVLEIARRGIYAMESLAGLPKALWRSSFLRGTGRNEGTVRVSEALQRMVSFERLNLVSSTWPEEGGFDAVFCRNTLIYFDRQLQREIVARLARRVRPGGLLVLGHSENLLASEAQLESVGITAFRRPTEGERATPTTPPLPPRPMSRRIHMGGMYCSSHPTLVRTLLGSCVSVCLFDASRRIGGMNHFLLPEGRERGGRALAYGVHAMEVLINAIMRRGGERRRLRAKAFGGAELLSRSDPRASVATRNVEFVRKYLEDESIPLVGEKLGGSHPLDLRFETHSGRAFARSVGTARIKSTAAEEAAFLRQINTAGATSRDNGVELFEVDHE